MSLRTVRRFLFAFLIVALFMPALPAAAQEPVEPADPAAVPAPREGEPNGSLRFVGGAWLQDEARAETMDAAQAAATGGPDQFGHLWANITPGWIEASDGADTGLQGNTFNNVTGAVPLPFDFPFYENSYNALYISAAGYLSFTPSQEFDDQFYFGSASSPSNLIGAYVSPFTLATSGRNSRVFYKAGGTAPGRYFIVQWNKMQSQEEGDTFTFQLVLWESGDIIINYKEMIYQGGWYCGNAGIVAASSLDLLESSPFCDRVPSNTSVQFSRPAAGGRLLVHPLTQGALTAAGRNSAMVVTVKNTGNVGPDTYAVTLASDWPARVLGREGAPLADTNGDGKIDSGPVAPGQRVDLTVIVDAPPVATAGMRNVASLTIASGRTPANRRVIPVIATISNPFASTFYNGPGKGVHLQFAYPTGEQTIPPARGWEGDMPTMATAPNGGYVVVTENTGEGGGIDARLVNAQGVAGPLKRVVGPTAGVDVTTGMPVAAVAPDGSIAVSWENIEWRWTGSTYEHSCNVMARILDGNGDPKTGVINLTQQTQFGAWQTPGVPCYFKVTIAATPNNRFVIGWTREDYNGQSWLDNAEIATVASSGALVRGVTRISTSAALGMDDAWSTMLAPMSGNRVALVYSAEYAVVVILDSSGAPTGLSTQLSTAQWVYGLAAAELASGNLLVAYNDYDSSLDGSSIFYEVRDGASLAARVGRTSLNSSAVPGDDWYPAIAPTADGGAVIQWMSSHYAGTSRYLAIAAIDALGNVAIPASPFAIPTFNQFVAKEWPSVRDAGHHTVAIAAQPTAGDKADVMVTVPPLLPGPAGGPAAMAIQIVNSGGLIAQGTTLRVDLPPGVRYATSSPPANDVAPAEAAPDAGQSVTWNLASLGFLEGGTVFLSATLPDTAVGTEHPTTVTATTTTPVVNPERGIAQSVFRESFGMFLPRVSE
jgi:hypothetical protein